MHPLLPRNICPLCTEKISEQDEIRQHEGMRVHAVCPELEKPPLFEEDDRLMVLTRR